MKNIKEVSKLTGLTERSLRYYEELGLINPSRNEINDYRQYSDSDVEKLYQIQLYRSLEIPLKKISEIFFYENTSEYEIYLEQIDKLKKKRDDLNKILADLQRKIEGEKIMEKDFKNVNAIIADNEVKYGQEIREKYGNQVVDKANDYLRASGGEKLDSAEELRIQINELLTQLVTEEVSIEDEKAKKLFALHKEWLEIYYPNYSKEYHLGLADMYEFDERFAKYYDDVINGGMKFIVDTIRKYA